MAAADAPGGTAGLVLAAGASHRYGGLKQLTPFLGQPLLEHSAKAMTEALGAATFVVLGHEAERIAGSADLGEARLVTCPDWSRGQAASLRYGVEAARRAMPRLDAVVIVLGDQPLVSAKAIRRVGRARAGGAQVARATYGGRPGHPVLIAGDALAGIGGLRGDRGARELVESHGFMSIPCDDAGSDRDIDTPGDLARMEREQRSRAIASRHDCPGTR